MTQTFHTLGKADPPEVAGMVAAMVAGPPGRNDGDFSLSSFAILTYQEYSYQAQAESIDALLCKAFGHCGDHHA